MNRPRWTRAEQIRLAAVLLLAALLRFWSIDFGLPDWWARPDEANVASRVLRMVVGGTWSPEFFEYPAAWLYLLRLPFWAAARIGIWTGTWSDLQGCLAAYVADPGPWLLGARSLSALCGVATVGACAALARRLGGSPWLAGLLLAVAPLHVRDSRFGVTDVAATLAVAGALLWSDRLRRPGGPARGDLLGAGLWVGLAAATKYNAALVGVAPALALFLARPRELGRARAFAWVARRTAIVAAVAAALFLALNPYVLLDAPTFARDFAFQARHMAEGHGRDLGLGWTYHLSRSLRYGLTPPLWLAALAGIALALFRPRRHAALLPPLAFALLYYAAMGGARTVFFRYVIPLLPVCVLAAELALRTLAARLPLAARRRPLATALLALLVAVPAASASIAHARLIGRGDTRQLAERWLRDHVPPHQGVILAGANGVPPYGEPRLPGLEWCQILTLERRPPVCPLEAPFPTARIIDPRPGLGGRAGPEFPWIVTHEHELSRYSALHYRLRAELERRAEELVRFEPGAGTGARHGVFDPIDAYYAPIAGLGGYRRPGPTIRVWRLRAIRD